MVHLLRAKATADQLAEMLETLGAYIKLAVDIEKEIAAGGGVLHADCEAVLLDAGSRQADIWGRSKTLRSESGSRRWLSRCWVAYE
jgi:hypothetical protein